MIDTQSESSRDPPEQRATLSVPTKKRYAARHNKGEKSQMESAGQR